MGRRLRAASHEDWLQKKAAQAAREKWKRDNPDKYQERLAHWREYQRRRRAARRGQPTKPDPRRARAVIARWKTMRGCRVCGYRGYSGALELHHDRRGGKVYDFGGSRRHLSSGCTSVARFRKALRQDGVILLCSICHRAVEGLAGGSLARWMSLGLPGCPEPSQVPPSSGLSPPE